MSDPGTNFDDQAEIQNDAGDGFPFTDGEDEAAAKIGKQIEDDDTEYVQE
jgi:hypothetical protein